MKYTYSDMKDKTKEGILNETKKGLGFIMFHMQTTQGMPHEITAELFNEIRGDGRKLLFYLDYRNKYPDLDWNSVGI